MGLVSTVHVFDDRGEAHIFGPDNDVPQWATSKMGAHCFTDGVHPGEPAPERQAGQEPPRAGRGASREAWHAYASEIGVTVDPSAPRDEVIAAVDAAQQAGEPGDADTAENVSVEPVE